MARSRSVFLYCMAAALHNPALSSLVPRCRLALCRSLHGAENPNLPSVSPFRRMMNDAGEPGKGLLWVPFLSRGGSVPAGTTSESRDGLLAAMCFSAARRLMRARNNSQFKVWNVRNNVRNNKTLVKKKKTCLSNSLLFRERFEVDKMKISLVSSKVGFSFPSAKFKALIYVTRNGWTEIHHETSWTNVAKHLSRSSTCSKDQARALRLLAQAEMSHLHREIASFSYRVAESFYISHCSNVRANETDRDREKENTRCHQS